MTKRRQETALAVCRRLGEAELVMLRIDEDVGLPDHPNPTLL
jgi:hypothetical protein